MIIAHAKDRLEAKEDSPLLWDFIEEIPSLEGWSEIARCKASRVHKSVASVCKL